MDTVKQTAVSYLITPVVENIMPYLPNFWSGRKELEKLKSRDHHMHRAVLYLINVFYLAMGDDDVDVVQDFQGRISG